MDNKRFVIILLIWTAIFTIMGGTLAYWNWQTVNNKNTNVTFTVNRDYTCGADSGGNITSSDVRLAPAKCNDPVYAIKRPITTSVTTTGDKVVSMDLWLNINNISTNLTNTPNFKWAITKNGNTCSGAINYGDFRNIQNNKIDLLSGVDYDDLDDTYYLYIWLDEAETNNNTMNGSFSFSISGKCTDNGLEKALLKSLDSTAYFREADYKEKITDISFIYDKDLPSGITANYVKTYDLGQNASKPITGYLIENTDPGTAEDTYKLYISSKYKIYAGSLRNAFQEMTALKNIQFDNLDTSLATNMSGLFYGCRNLTYLDVSMFNTSKVTDMGNMFAGCKALTSINVSNFNTSNVTSMDSLFYNCSGLTSLNVSNFDTSKVVNFKNTFRGLLGLTELDVSNFDTSSVTNMSTMFTDDSNIAFLDVSNFNTSQVTNMYRMFTGCSSLMSLDVTNFDTSKVTNMDGMFGHCSSLTELDLSRFNILNVTIMSWMFNDCSNLNKIYVSDLWDTSAVTTSANMFNNASKLPNFNSSVTDKTNAHYGEGGYLTYKAYNG